MKKSNKPTFRSSRKVGARRRRAGRDTDDASRAELIREFDRAEPAPPTKEIELMTEEERKIFLRPSSN
jgi:hypothetical protein